MLKRSAAQQTALDQLLAEQQDRSSRNYHAWLTPEQFGDRFGASPNDVAQVVSWLQSEGLAVDEVSRARNWIWFSGTAARMQAALRTQIRRYRVEGELHFANADEPSVPAAIEPLVIGIQGLDDFHPRSSRSRRVPSSLGSAPKSALPLFTSASGNHYLAPDDFATIYNLWPLYNAGYDGSGQRIVVAGRSAVDLTDIRSFRGLYGLPQNDPQLVLVPGSVDPGHASSDEEGEADL
ncbi:MAG TPA: protease pro-enzyme activation domain-containing protein, partial [Bryobacteraceae bacterium]|nr:protease pro-enzyme activation domain-containing protein [Bryobacteraceae bacterium]